MITRLQPKGYSVERSSQLGARHCFTASVGAHHHFTASAGPYSGRGTCDISAETASECRLPTTAKGTGIQRKSSGLDVDTTYFFDVMAERTEPQHPHNEARIGGSGDVMTVGSHEARDVAESSLGQRCVVPLISRSEPAWRGKDQRVSRGERAEGLTRRSGEVQNLGRLVLRDSGDESVTPKISSCIACCLGQDLLSSRATVADHADSLALKVDFVAPPSRVEHGPMKALDTLHPMRLVQRRREAADA